MHLRKLTSESRMSREVRLSLAQAALAPESRDEQRR